jgi:hypothetical protein
VTLSRRSLIHGLLLTLGLDRIVAGQEAGRRAHEAAAQPAPPDAALRTETVSGPELNDLVAFAEILVGGASLSPIERGYLVDHIEDRVKQASGYLSFYRTTVSLLGRLAGARFSTLDATQRLALMTRHRLNSSRVWPDEDLGPFPDDQRAVRTRVVPDLIAAYYRCPAGWAVAGYDAFPGRCSDLARYTGPGH